MVLLGGLQKSSGPFSGKFRILSSGPVDFHPCWVFEGRGLVAWSQGIA